eukprot:CAMPEP_0117002690 /NCGR_PEP_ID=MMETSP0472-20121206/4270_1 /TAXON_ID=693140 ORGANISM="Tiarina fusus, Strain LIS" /NCGR_SAMPLE_ID=MMETSP0472 /ASSEMBLY_ACC=CAM_ASM_000603 /LENGTH=870 /DNA_ID=CAMNT_0004703111 /DNA_START=1121 /DNA_END=3733 /DNA_ORIENTATION=-
MRSHDCTPVSFPQLPPTFQHPLWRAWDLAADICISQLPALIKNPKIFQPNPFFGDQLTAFEIWLEFAAQKDKTPPEQLPIVLQVLLSKQHRLKALQLLSQFLDLGSWAVNYALSVGIFPYVLKLLQSPVPELRSILVSIWTKILALDPSCKQDLLKDSGHVHFSTNLTSPNVTVDQRTKSIFILTTLVRDFRQGQAACLNHGLITACLRLFSDSNAEVRRWSILCVAKLWEDYNEAKWVAIRENAHEKLCSLLTDPSAEVRTAAIYALGTFIGGAGDNEDRQQIETNIALTLFVVTADMSTMARRELIISLTRLIFARTEEFLDAVIEMSKEELKLVNEFEARKRDKRRLLSTSSPGLRSNSKPGLHGGTSVCSSIWKVILSFRYDPFPSCSSLAKKLVQCVFSKVADILTVSIQDDVSLQPLLSHVQRRAFDQQPSTPSQSRKKNALLSPLRVSRRSSGNLNSSLDPAIPSVTKIEFEQETFPSHFFDWSFDRFTKPKSQEVDQTSPEVMECDWRLRRQTKFHDEIQNCKETASRYKFDTQVSLMNDSETEVVALAKFHPTEPLCVVADDKNRISVWNWEESAKVNSFSNQNGSNTRISSLCLANTQSQFLVLVGSSNGIIRVWRDVSEKPKLVSAWRALSDSSSPTHSRRSGLIFDWNQANGHLITAGNAPIIRIWDVERELSIQDVPTGTETTCVTSLSHQPGSSTNSLLVAGCGDGSLKLFDVRMSQKNGVTAVLDGHRGWILGTPTPQGNIHTIASGDTSGEVKFWDCRATKSPRATFSVHRGEMTSFALHDYSDIFCTGTQNQKIRLASSKDGKEINSIRYHDGLILGQRIGPVSCLAFHPYKLLLAAGATDSIISMYRPSQCT